MSQLVRRYGYGLSGILVLITAFWLLMLVVLPDLYLFENSFRPYLPAVDVGGPKDFYSFDNYLNFFQTQIHIQVFALTVLYSSLVIEIRSNN